MHKKMTSKKLKGLLENTESGYAHDLVSIKEIKEFLGNAVMNGDFESFKFYMRLYSKKVGVEKLASQMKIERPNLYRITSEEGNPTGKHIFNFLKIINSEKNG